MSQVDVQICEVGPRDGLQNAKHLMPTEAKKAWISAMAAAGLTEIEVGSFVPPKLIPAMADTAEVVAHALTLPGVKVVTLAPNVKGYQRAVETGSHKIAFPVSASFKHSVSNVRMTPDEMVAQVKACCELRSALPEGQRPEIEGAISTAFGCTLQGEVPEDEVVRIARLLVDAGVDCVALADTVGYANPAQIKRLFRNGLPPVLSAVTGNDGTALLLDTLRIIHAVLKGHPHPPSTESPAIPSRLAETWIRD